MKAGWAKRVTRLDEPVYGHYCYCLCPVHHGETGGICEGSPLTAAVEFTTQPVLTCGPCGEWWRERRTALPGEIIPERGELPGDGGMLA